MLKRPASLLALALGLVTLGLYLPAVRHAFLWYDDQQYVTENSQVQAGLTSASLGWAFGFHASNWHPLTWMSHMLDCQWYGLNPAGHHLTNVLFHLANSLLLFVALFRLTRAPWRSAVVAALFAWHPLHVESVAWVAERKDVLCAFFWMLTLWAYSHYVAAIPQPAPFSGTANSAPKPRILCWYLATLTLFALGLMSKPMAVTLPFVLLLLDFWPLGRLANRTSQWSASNPAATASPQLTPPGKWLPLLEKVPLLGLSAVVCILTVKAQGQAFSIVSTSGLPLSERLGHALLAYGHYLQATFLPIHLAVYYPYERAFSPVHVAICAFGLLLVSGLAVRFAKRRPYLLVGWLWFLGTLAPVIGLVQVGDQAWADRYTYLPLIGLFVVLAWSGFDLATRLPAIRLLAAAALVALLGLTSIQLSHWKDTRTLFEHTASVTRNNYMALTVLGSELARENRLDEAIEHYRTALRYKPGLPEAHFFLGNAFEQQGKLAEAAQQYQAALRSGALREQVHIRMGVLLAQQQKYPEAIQHYNEALRLNPDSALAHQNLARLLQTQGRFAEAIEHYRASLKLSPNLAQAHNNLGILLLQTGHPEEGVSELREAARLNPENAETEYNLALALNQQRQWSEAEPLFAKTVSPASKDPNALYQYALALARTGKTREAMALYARSLLVRPDFPEALDGLSWLLATAPSAELRNGPEAVRMAELACDLTQRKDPGKLKTLSAAYAESGKFGEALATASNALQLATTNGQSQLASECRQLLDSFQAAKPWRATQQ